MPGIIWIGLAILGVHLVVALVIIIYVNKSYKLLDSRTEVLVSSVNDAAENISRIGNRTDSAIRAFTEL